MATVTKSKATKAATDGRARGKAKVPRGMDLPAEGIMVSFYWSARKKDGSWDHTEPSWHVDVTFCPKATWDRMDEGAKDSGWASRLTEAGWVVGCRLRGVGADYDGFHSHSPRQIAEMRQFRNRLMAMLEESGEFNLSSLMFHDNGDCGFIVGHGERGLEVEVSLGHHG